ncbi:MAG: discoidin domain-containing protein [Sphingobacteriaceae bacterium]|nr:discoidin domain-containing protein [Sphingobacteriaceae bacterium]
MIIKLRMDVVMYRMRIAIFLSFACLISLFPQTTYYVSSSQGNDSNSGTSENSPWKTIGKLNSRSFNPGDNILFKRGDQWAGSELIIKNSGTSENRIIFSAYGNGKKPILTLKAEINKTWNQYNSEVWYITTPIQAIPIERMWFNDLEKEQAKSLTGDNWDGTFGICPEHPFYHNTSEGRLYVYSIMNPSTYYSTIEYQGGLLDEQIVEHTVQLVDADYVTLDGLDIQGGGYGALGLAGSDYSLIKNCNIGKYSSRAGIFANSSRISKLANDQTSDHGEISNCIIDSDWNYTLKFYTSLTPYGILIGFGASNWRINGNYIKDWWFGIYSGGAIGQVSLYHKIFSNEIESPNFSYGKGIQVYTWNDPETGVYVWSEIYNNYIHNIRGAGIALGSSGNKVYFNIIDSVTVSACPEKGDQDNTGMGIEIQHEDYNVTMDDNYIFNNTFYQLNRSALNWSYPFSFNNLFLNMQMVNPLNFVAISQSSALRDIKNNLFFKTGSSVSSYFVYLFDPSKGYTINGLNALGGTVSGNIYPEGHTLLQIMNSDFTLPNSSPALNSGIDISSFVPEGFTDRNGNVVNRTKPDIGAVQHFTGDTSPPTLVSGTLLDSTKLSLTFSEPLSSLGIATLLNYSVSDGVVVYSAELNANQTTIVLTTSPHTFGQNYSCSVYNLQDQSGNFLSTSNNSITYFSIFDRPSVGYVNKLTITKVTASNMDESPEKTIDGVYYSNGGEADSRWKATPLPQWLVYDLGAVKQISITRISFYGFQQNRIYNYSISVSKDSVNWIEIVKNAASSNQEWTVNIFNPVEAKYLKLEITGNNQNDWATVWETEIWGSSSVQAPIQIKPKVFLQGAYENGQMRNNLRGSTLIPLNQPYTSAPWHYNGYESVPTIPNDVVDWVLIELRSDISSAATAKRAAFVKKDGTIVDLDGQSPVNVYGISSGSYYLVIAHRNHLKIMSADKVALAESSALYDFTISPSKSYGNDLANLGEGKYGMYSGDADANGIVNVLDYGIVGNMLFQTGYLAGDLDLNGSANVLDYGKANQNLLKVSNVP